ncbi:hypothetical protein ZIOFF_018038 [Zingiber officinale]|uniref:HMA domain-containing protein n=1 Tax=Zingiber officinale TaxID=94328 RepID=A0A8J5HFY4_ZINOF|nr:hypothetical protein ZIOFF_018038 [Zingiber officinale]
MKLHHFLFLNQTLAALLEVEKRKIKELYLLHSETETSGQNSKVSDSDQTAEGDAAFQDETATSALAVSSTHAITLLDQLCDLVLYRSGRHESDSDVILVRVDECMHTIALGLEAHLLFSFFTGATCTLKVNIHCDGCKKKVKKLLHKIEGVYTTNIDAEQGKVSVSGNVDPATLIKKLAKAGKHAELLGAGNGSNKEAQKPQPQNGKGQQKENGKPQKGGGGGGGGGNGGGKEQKPQLPQLTPQQQMMFQQQLQQFQQMKGSNDLQMPPQLKGGFSFPPQKNPKAPNFGMPPKGCDDAYDDEEEDYDDDYEDDDDDEMDEFDCFDADLEDDFKDIKIKPVVAATAQDKKGGNGKKGGETPVQGKAVGNNNETKSGKKGDGGGGSAIKNIGGGGGGKNGGGGQQQGKNGLDNNKGTGSANGGGGCNPNPGGNGGKKGVGKNEASVAGGHPAANPKMMGQGFPGMAMGPQIAAGNMHPHPAMGHMGNIPAVAAGQVLPAGGPPPAGYYQGGIVPPPLEANAVANPYQQQSVAAMMQQQQQQQQYMAAMMQQQQQQQQRMMMMNAAQDRAFQPPMMGYARPPIPAYYSMNMPPPAMAPPHHGDPYNYFSDENTDSGCTIM